MFKIISDSLSGVNNSKLVMAIFMLTLNVGSKYVDFRFSKAQEHILRNTVTRELLIFAVTFTATRDILLSIIITSVFFIISNVLFHEESKHCIIPEKMKRIKALIDTNNDEHISAKEEEKAIEILKRADKARKKNVQATFLSHLATTSTLI
jgi:hypothetical protein